MSQASRLTKASIQRFFKALPDPRPHQGKVVHPLITIVVICLCATVAGANDFQMIAEFARSRFDWLSQFLDLSNGVPSHDTLERVFANLDPIAFQRCLLEWVAALHGATDGKIIAIDGKAAREAMNRSTDKGPLCLVTAWASANHMLLGQVAGPEGSNELGALPQLLELLDLEGAIVTLDALGCQKEIVKQIVDKKGDYVISVKGNQEKLHAVVMDSFEAALSGEALAVGQTHTSQEKGHGRVEERTTTSIDVPDAFENKEEWEGIKSFAMVVRTTHKHKQGESTEPAEPAEPTELAKATESKESKESKEPTVGIRYYISSLPANAKKAGDVVRGHWRIENHLHWRLDVAFAEDLSRARQKNAQANLGIVRRVALSMIHNAPHLKGSMASKRQQAAWNEQTLENIILGTTA